MIVWVELIITGIGVPEFGRCERWSLHDRKIASAFDAQRDFLWFAGFPLLRNLNAIELKFANGTRKIFWFAFGRQGTHFDLLIFGAQGYFFFDVISADSHRGAIALTQCRLIVIRNGDGSFHG